MENHWAWCPDRNGVCGVVVAHGEHAARDAERIARMGAELDKVRVELARARAEARDLERENASLRRRLREGGR